MNLEFEYDNLLMCPNCKTASDLHHEKVEVFMRPEEDAEFGLVTVCEKGATHIDDEGVVSNKPGGNPSGRRDGLRITFKCYPCGSTVFMNLAQSKGRTEMSMSYLKEVA